MTQPIFMVGPRGCGKTTVGQALAKELGYAFTDTDDMLSKLTGNTVAEIISNEGWEGFRARESEILTNVTQGHTVVATGGGIVLSLQNRRFMRSRGTVIYLHAETDELVRRLQSYPEEAQRPSLTGKSMIDEISAVLEEREVFYQEAAHHVLDAGLSSEDVVYSILQQLYPNTAG